jgi:hypothetical protein
MQGILVGSDQAQEYLLPWWWQHYSLHNTYPVIFIDFGMSSSMRKWCEERGECRTVSKEIPLQAIPQESLELWKLMYGEGFSAYRKVWFQKPSALLQSPFALNLWIDLDCKIGGSLEPLFASLSPSTEIGLVEDIDGSYNAGVILFKQNSTIVNTWAHLILHHNATFAGDQEALYHALSIHPHLFTKLPFTYNWVRKRGPHPSALIYHYTGSIGKQMIMEELED